METEMRGSIWAVASILGASVANAQNLPQASSPWYQQAQEALQERLANQPNTKRAKNVILFVADGNGVGTNYASRLFAGQQQGNAFRLDGRGTFVAYACE